MVKTPMRINNLAYYVVRGGGHTQMEKQMDLIHQFILIKLQNK